MKVLVVHNYYQLSGGEDTVVKNEIELLTNNGHKVDVFFVYNNSIKSVTDKILTSLRTPFSIKSYRAISKSLKSFQPDIVHVHNYFPLLSPSIFYACQRVGIPVVHTLHNYRAICPTSTLFFKGKIVDTSIRKPTWWAIRYRVFKNSYIATFILCVMIELHKRINTWTNTVSHFIVMNEIAKRNFIAAGWPQNKITIKPHSPGNSLTETPLQKNFNSGYALFIGRLNRSKGFDILLDAWRSINFSLIVIGEPDDFNEKDVSAISTQIKFIGKRTQKEVASYIREARFVIVPSVSLETFGLIIVESFACSTPVICSDIESFKEIVDDGQTGLLFKTGDAADLIDKARYLLENKELCELMSKKALQVYNDKYSSGNNYQLLLDIYHRVLNAKK